MSNSKNVEAGSLEVMQHPFAKIEFPDQQKTIAEMIQAWELVAYDVIGFMDGLSLCTE